MKVSDDVLEVLYTVECKGRAAVIGGDRLDRAMYAKVNKVLDLAGGKWSRVDKAHVFEGDAADALEQVLLTGQILNAKQELGAFDTPVSLAEWLVRLAGVGPGVDMLEPSAGVGRLALPAQTLGARVWAIEVDPKKAALLESMKLRHVRCADFLSVSPSPGGDVHCVAMNPPFPKKADIAHITHAAKFVRPGGKLAAIASAGVVFREDQATKDFRALVDRQAGRIQMLPAGSFKESGTMANTCAVEMFF